MNTAEILKHVDHTLLKPIATWEDIQKICDESIEYNTASICIPSCYISRINEKYGVNGYGSTSKTKKKTNDTPEENDR